MTTPPPPDSTPPNVLERLARLERQQAPPPPPSRDTSGKDVWDIVQIVGAALIPVAIAAGGWFYSEASGRAQIESARQMHERDAEIALSEARVRQAGLLKDFLDALTGSDVAKRRVAIQAVLIAMPQDGPNLVRELSQSTPDSGEARFARNALVDRCAALIRRLFSADAPDRKAASIDLVDGWRDTPWMIDSLVAHARRHLDDGNGVFNTLGVLAEVTPTALAARRPTVEAFLAEATGAPVAGAKIREQADRVRARLGRPAPAS